MSFPYGSKYEEMAKAMDEVMRTHPLAGRAMGFRDGTDPELTTQAKKDEARVHYYEWLQDEAQKLLKKKTPPPALTPTAVPGAGGKAPEPKPWTAGENEAFFKDDALCNCPDCRKERAENGKTSTASV